MSALLKNKSILLIGFLSLIGLQGFAQWKPAMEGMLADQEFYGKRMVLEFKPDGPMGKDWVYGSYFDEDTVRRYVAYREAGKWKPLPFHGSKGSKVVNMEMYRDTLYLLGMLKNIVLDKNPLDTIAIETGLLKWYKDSLWADTSIALQERRADISSKGDSLIIWGEERTFAFRPTYAPIHLITTDGGVNWQNPYSTPHPSDSTQYFGYRTRIEILDNGDIITLNNPYHPRGFNAICRWDGSQWHPYGTIGKDVSSYDFEFYRGELYMSGFFHESSINSPGKSIARWDGTKWNNDLATGIFGLAYNMFVYDDILYTMAYIQNPDDVKFGDASIPHLAGWDGSQWCGTPFTYHDEPATFGFVNDTLYATFYTKGTANGDSITYMNYYDGDYLHGPNSICSTLGLGEEESRLEDILEIFPNPSQNEVTVLLNPNFAEGFYTLYTLNGGEILSGTLELKENTLDLSSIPAGIYLLKVEAGKMLTHKRLMVK